MAKSPAHRFGQIIGEVLEAAILPLLQNFAGQHGLYLDKQGSRPARRGKKVTWMDRNGNKHDLDFVLERNGSDEALGTPVAFIESAWRRYTKHSRNKAQEIQGAILPLMETYQSAAPFAGVILAGVFTQGALDQLRSLKFAVVYFPYKVIIEAFRKVGIDARFEENTPDAEFDKKVKAYNRLSEEKRKTLAEALVRHERAQINEFIVRLEKAVTRYIESVRVLPLHGIAQELPSVQAAVDFVCKYGEADGHKPIVGYEIQIRYNNGDRIEGRFSDKNATIEFLHIYEPASKIRQ